MKKTAVEKEWDEILRERGMRRYASLRKAKEKERREGAYTVEADGCIWNGLNYSQRNDVVAALHNAGHDYEARRVN